ncbi:hypothetical protein [Sphingobacterium litopenaei]|uniref:Uncharacterized protein n=1 Tax=Sphingobacterium litopenaei TaxID=2763500 RepID=A0ABR7YH21_9SPHI|nr:hypothetical protein [Sphingobacterium litopenaei]MBD1430613.1 hypothetical protein [Sphingobacterium litopenaei]
MNTRTINTNTQSTGAPLAPSTLLFSHESLIELGFDFMGFCWGWNNKPYHQIDTQIGELCIVNYSEVYLVRKREELLARIDTLDKLKQFVSLISNLEVLP